VLTVALPKLKSEAIILLTILLVGLSPTAPMAAPQLRFFLTPSMGGNEPIVQNSPDNGTLSVKGVLEVMVLAVDFTDTPSNRTLDYLNQLFLQRLRTYISEISYGKVTIEGKVAGIFHLSKPMTSYGADNGMIDGDAGVGLRTSQLVDDALAAADPTVDFSNYQYIVIVHAGEGQESDPKITDNIWSVTYLGGVWFRTQHKSFDKAAIVPEREGQGADVLGVVAHEFLHLLGLPDLYNTHGTNQGDAGRWDVMARGLWNGNPPGSGPAHPTAWSKIRLGWIEQDQVAQVGSGDSSTDYLGPIEQPQKNMKAVKVQLSESKYYLIEFRSRAYDPNLPDQGVLITKVDTGSVAYGGPLTVISIHGGSSNATLKLGEYYASSTDNLLVSIRFVNSTTYGVDLIRGQYRIIELNMPSSTTSLLVDGKPCTAFPSGVTRVFVTPDAHVITIPKVTYMSDKLRAVFEGWSDGITDNERAVQANDNVTLSILYTQQVLLSITSSGIQDPSHPTSIDVNGTVFALQDLTPVESWVDTNRTVKISVITNAVDVDEGTRYVFDGWKGNGANTMSITGDGNDSNSTSIHVALSEPAELTAQFKRQYYLNVRSEFGSPVGEGWYDDGSRADFRVTSPSYVDDYERYLFESWSGADTRAPVGEVVMDNPYFMTAQWKRQLLVNITVIGSDGVPLQSGALNMEFEAPNGTDIHNSLLGHVWMDEGVWKLKRVLWMNVDASPFDATFKPSKNGVWIVRPRVFSLAVLVSTKLLRTGVQGVTVSLQLPDGTPYSLVTNRTGYVLLVNLPASQYTVSITRNADLVANTQFYVIEDTSLEVRVSDPVEDTLTTAFIVFGIISMGIIVTPTALARLRPRRKKRIALPLHVLENRVYYYILRHKGVISKSTAAKDLGISTNTLMSVIYRLKKTHSSLNEP
jgi:M6 family metalloprotease-like protein